ncbi:hypothetical protein RND81_13G207900 [Saponaria officinalis]|uniref:GDSL esterase/lipase n=1 Tax=Saponaria officinalis TaxID=3572 RepID=A0AAW1H6P6_SAPOF
MGFTKNVLLVTFVIAIIGFQVSKGQPLVPIFCIFGDSVVDSGNNNGLYTIIKANFPPYGRDFVTHQPTGRFSNGKIATDFTVLKGVRCTEAMTAHCDEAQGKSACHMYMRPRTIFGNKFLIGANFASAGSGYSERTANLYRAISLTQQLAYYKDYQSKIAKMVGNDKANAMFSGGIHLLSAGNNDYLQNYYVNPNLYRQYTADQLADSLMTSFSNFVQTLYGVGVRRIGVTSLPPMGCLPAAITLFGAGSNQCIDRLNRDATSFNSKLNNCAQALQTNLPGLKLVVFDIYTPLLDMIAHPIDNGFFEARKACCGTGTIETSLLCNARSVGTCSNATQYVFWDGFHPSEAANQVLAGDLLTQGFPLIG